jgi:hypothetical protein
MPASLLGEDGLLDVLESSCRIVLVNGLPGDDPTKIVAAAFVYHREDGTTQTFATYDLELGPDQTHVFDEDRPSASPVIAVEAMIRVVAEDTGIADGYASAEASDGTALLSLEFGIRSSPLVPSPGENVFKDLPALVAYADVPE